MKSQISVFTIMIFFMVSAVNAQTPHVSTENFFKVTFPCDEGRDTANGSDKSYLCNLGMQFYKLTVYRHTETEIAENGKKMIRDLVEDLVHTVPYDSFDTMEIDFHGHEGMRFSSKGFISYETIAFNVYDRMFVIEVYSVNEGIDQHARDLYLNSFEILDNELEALKAINIENRQKKIENIKRRQDSGRQ